MKVFHVSWNEPETVFHEMLWKKNFTVYPSLISDRSESVSVSIGLQFMTNRDKMLQQMIWYDRNLGQIEYIFQCAFLSMNNVAGNCGLVSIARSSQLQSSFIEIALRHGCSLVNLLHFSKTPFLRNTSGWLLLYFLKKSL